MSVWLVFSRLTDRQSYKFHQASVITSTPLVAPGWVLYVKLLDKGRVVAKLGHLSCCTRHATLCHMTHLLLSFSVVLLPLVLNFARVKVHNSILHECTEYIN